MGDVDYDYEVIDNVIGMPFKIFLHSVKELKLHWHRQLEILFVMSGEITVNINNKVYVLREKDLIIINPSDIHSTASNNSNNTVLALQIDPYIFNRFISGFSDLEFNCKSFESDDFSQKKYDYIRWILAKLVWELNKKKKGYSFITGELLLKLARYLYLNFSSKGTNKKSQEFVSKDKIDRILKDMDENYEKGITLSELADKNDLSVHYLSRIIKESIGFTFQEYIDRKKLQRAVTLLIETNKTITEIAYESGFPNLKSLSRLIKREHGCTPGDYRNRHTERIFSKIDTCSESPSYFDIERKEVLNKLYMYLDKHKEEDTDTTYLDEIRTVEISSRSIKELNKTWNKIITFGRAHEGLRDAWRKQFREIQNIIGFKYARFHGIFCDEMMIYNVDLDGNVKYNWTYLDDLFDFLLLNGVKPFIELGFMPSEISSLNRTIFWWEGNISQPNDINLWTDLVKSLLRHCINRYGQEEVNTWYFEVWNEPEIEGLYWIGGRDSYFNFYRQTVMAVKEISNDIKVGGPSVTHGSIGEGSFLDNFIKYTVNTNTPLDFLTIHIYPDYIPMDSEDMDEKIKLLQTEEGRDSIMSFAHVLKRAYHKKDHSKTTLERINSLLNSHNIDIPIFVTEWGTSANSRNPVNDTMFVATYLVRNLLHSRDLSKGIGYWAFTDLFEEFKLGLSHFHGGFGLVNKDGIKKPSYYAFELLNKLGDKVVDESDGYLVTRKGDSYQIISYNFVYFDEAYQNGDISALCEKERYKIYQEESNIQYNFKLRDLEGQYKITRYRLNRKTGSAFDKWIDMGMPENMSSQEVEYLKAISRPEISISRITTDNKLDLNIYLEPHGIELITIDRII